MPGSGWSIVLFRAPGAGPLHTLACDDCLSICLVCSCEAEDKLGCRAVISFPRPHTLPCQPGLTGILLAPCWQRNAPSLRLPRVVVLISDLCLSPFLCYALLPSDAAGFSMSNSTASYKQLKEDFVSNLTGGTVSEIAAVTAVLPVSQSTFL